ncbi:MAG: hypothetical protein H7Y42_13885 [Chitinophagaceae bacterium]|nr:hypothetical protein [Chitinophagaceae bacterium]
METYTSEQANYLMEYYGAKIVGGLLEESTGSKAVGLFMENVDDEKYIIQVEGTLIRGVVKPKRRLDLVAKTQGLPSPAEILRDRSV